MKNRYKVPWHVRQYVKKELMDYKRNKQLVKKLKNTRQIILVSMRLSQIEEVFQSLNKEDLDAAETIFLDQYSVAGAEVAKGISKTAYYNVMNKVIYLTAIKMDLI